ncbi:MAG TPA: response regulator [Candidatus Eisenbacteria bacterium]|nr:response regulator [Candidatus Eisenbacteria bacterium]
MNRDTQPLRGNRILIVEDNALVAKFFRMALERAGGCECIISEDVPEILSHVAAGEVDLVLLDVSLTNSEWKGQAINGIELCRLLKERSTRRLPVLLATAHAMSGDRERFLESSGADGYLEKPVYDSSVLVEKVRSLINPS